MRAARMGPVAAAVLVAAVVLAAVLAAGAAEARPKKPKGAVYSACGVKSKVAWKSWTGELDTVAPLVFPKSDAELKSIVEAAHKGGCVVRPAGTGHTFDGFVLQKTESKVIVVNLGNYVPPPAWNMVLNPSAPSARMGAGRTFLDLMAFVRPAGFLLSTQTAGWFFSLGGVFMNPSVHGGGIGKERMCSLVTGLYVMLGNGTTMEITNPADVKVWRGSLGLLGLVLGVQVQLIPDQGLQMFYDEKTFTQKTWTQKDVSAFITSSLTGKDHAEWFVNMWTGTIQALTMNHKGGAAMNRTIAAYAYYQFEKNFPTLATTGVPVPVNNPLAAALASFNGTLPELGALVSTVVLSMNKGTWQQSAQAPRDGYYLIGGAEVHYNNLAVYIPCSSDCVTDGTVFGALSATRNLLLQASAVPQNTTYVPLMPCEFRFVDAAANTLLLEHLQPGRYLSMECLDLAGVIRSQDLQYGAFFAKLEAALKLLAKGRAPQVHHGKQWGFAPISAGLPVYYPFRNTADIEGFYSSQVRADFIAQMNRFDPDGVFRAGEGLHLLGLPNASAFEPRGLTGQSCDVLGPFGCVSGCCAFTKDTCLATGAAHGHKCAMDCQCKSGKCKNKMCA